MYLLKLLINVLTYHGLIEELNMKKQKLYNKAKLHCRESDIKFTETSTTNS